jgi:hypothetical protein
MAEEVKDATGTATTGTADTFNPDMFVKAEDFARFEGKVTAMMDNFATVGKTPTQPEPTGPTVTEKMAEYDAALGKLDEAFDKAVHEGKGAAAIQQKREAIIQAKADLKYGSRIAELESFGVHAIDQLSGEVVKGSMPHLAMPEVKAAYDQAIDSMEPNQRMNPEARRLAYKFAIGENMERILELEKEKILRDVETQTTTPGVKGKETPTVTETGYPEGVPDPNEYFSQDNLDALDAKGQSIDDFCRSMGYADWGDYYEKTIKEEEE